MSGKVSTEIRREASQILKPIGEQVLSQMTTIRANAATVLTAVQEQSTAQVDSMKQALADVTSDTMQSIEASSSHAEKSALSSASAHSSAEECRSILSANRKTMIRVAILSGAVAFLLAGGLSAILIVYLH
jgi:hypothetical protein